MSANRSGSPRSIRLLPTLLVLLLAASACTPRVQDFGPPIAVPALVEDAIVTADGRRLPMARWLAETGPEAVLLALHGFNMYRRYFEDMAPWLAKHGITTYAYDQRGFGAAPEPGIWGGSEAMADDARTAVTLLRERHPGVPVYLLGDSMGAAVALKALASPQPPVLDGAILVAPAVWGGEAMHPMLRAGLWLTAHLTPWNRATGGGLRRHPTDNIPMLLRLGRDPLVISYTRIDAVYGVSGLMGEALAAAPLVGAPVLVLYGANDEIVPPRPVDMLLQRLQAPHRLVYYSQGWHMLLRDLQAETVWHDISAWIHDRQGALPSGEEREDRRLPDLQGRQK